MTDNNFPWSMDKPVDELSMMFAKEASYNVLDVAMAIDYLLTRLKKAERERERLQAIVQESFETIEGLNDHLDDCGYIREGEEYGKE